jgi:DNA helicase TIP49 (TBP-interacting protein)
VFLVFVVDTCQLIGTKWFSYVATCSNIAPTLIVANNMPIAITKWTSFYIKPNL